MRVKRYDYRDQLGPGLPQLLADIEQMLLEGRYVLTEEVTRFEEAFAEYLGTSFVLGVNSGTDALVLALESLQIGPGHEVITQANTFHATVAAICQVGATPVLVDAEPNSYLMDMDHMESVLTPNTRAIIPVHLFGKPTAMSRVLTLADAKGIAVIEDAAQAHGARWKGKRVGTFGRLGCFSFHPSKNLAAAGDGGALCTDDEDLANRVRELRTLGQRGQNHHVRVGWNSKLDAIQARVLLEKLARLDTWNANRRQIAQRYREAFGGLELEFQRVDDDEEHVFHLFQIRTLHRDALLEKLRDAGVDAVVRYPTPIHRQSAFAEFGWQQGQFPISERLANELLCLPIRPGMSESEINCVTTTIHDFFR